MIQTIDLLVIKQSLFEMITSLPTIQKLDVVIYYENQCFSHEKGRDYVVILFFYEYMCEDRPVRREK